MRTAAAVGLSMILASCGLAGPTASATPVAGSNSDPVPAASAARIAPMTPAPPPGPSIPGFKCADASAGTTGDANVTNARIAEQLGFDRFVLQFDSKVPAYTVKRQAKPVFKIGGRGQPVTLNGTAGVLVQVHSATGSGTYNGPTDFSHPDFLVLGEARLIEDFEGYVSWGLGLNRPACMRVFPIPAGDLPPRLVIDFTTAPG